MGFRRMSKNLLIVILLKRKSCSSKKHGDRQAVRLKLLVTLLVTKPVECIDVIPVHFKAQRHFKKKWSRVTEREDDIAIKVKEALDTTDEEQRHKALLFWGSGFQGIHEYPPPVQVSRESKKFVVFCEGVVPSDVDCDNVKDLEKYVNSSFFQSNYGLRHIDCSKYRYVEV